MKKTNTVVNAAILILFAALVFYLGFAVLRRTQNAYVTTQAVLVTVNETGDASGCVVREELPITSDKAYISISVDDGKEVAAGGEIAIAVDSEKALENAARARELEMEIDYLHALLSNVSDASGAAEQDNAVRAAIYRLSAAVGAGDAARIDSTCVNLSSLLFTGGAAVTQSDLDALQAELRQLRAAGNDGSILAPAAGIFTTAADGYESLTPDLLDDITPDGVAALSDAKAAVGSNVIGKLITAKKWYYAAVMSEEDAARLSPGGTTTLDFDRHSSGEIPAVVRSISSPVDGQVAVVFALSRALTDTLGLRETSAEVVYASYTGLRVPLKAIHFDKAAGADGETTVVYVVTAGQMEMKPVEILYQTDEYCLVARADGRDALRAGDEVIVEGRNLADGKVIN